MDQTVKETVNKDTQTPGMTKGFSLKHNAFQHYYLTSMHNLRKTCMVNSNSSDSGYDHPYLHILGKRFGCARLRDPCIETEVIMEGSITGFVDGHKYNRCVRVHKLVYETLHR